MRNVWVNKEQWACWAHWASHFQVPANQTPGCSCPKAHVPFTPLPPFIFPQKKHKDLIKYVRGCLSHLSMHFIFTMAPTGSKRRFYLTVGVQHPSFLLFHVNEESKGGIIIYGRHMEHLTVLINILNYFIFGTKHTFYLLIRSFIITIFLFWTALLLWIIWGGVIFFFVLYVQKYLFISTNLS